MKYLFVTWDGGGNLGSELAVANRLVERGHEVRFLGHRSQQQAIEDSGCAFSAFRRAPDCDASQPETDLVRDWEVSSPPKAFARLRDRLFFGPADAFAADVLDELERHPADALAVDFMVFGAQAAAERSGLPAAALWHTLYAPPFVDIPPFGMGFGLPRGRIERSRNRLIRAVSGKMWEKGLPALNGARAGIGLPPLARVFEQLDRLERVLVTTSPAFDFAGLTGASLPANVRYVGPQIALDAAAAAAPPTTDGPPLVLVSLSTTYQAQEDLLARVVAAVGTLPVRAVVTTGPAVRVDDPVPPNVDVHTWLPHTEVLPDAALVVTHGGLGTTMTSLAHAVPVLCVPMGRDQLDVAARAVHAGAGRRLSKKADVDRLAAGIGDALADRSLNDNAARLARVFRAEIEADAAVREMEALTANSRAASPPTSPIDEAVGQGPA